MEQKIRINKPLRLKKDFYQRDALEVAPALLGKQICRYSSSGNIKNYIISEIEIYKGEDNLACHASKGRTQRTEIMYHKGGMIYMYLIYGIHWMFNIVTGEENNPQAILVRGINDIMGPGKVTKELDLDKSFYGVDLASSNKIWINNISSSIKIYKGKRIGIDYSGNYWKNKNWRFSLYKI